MKAAILEVVNQPLLIDDVEIVKPGANEVLVRTAAVGLCHTDLHYINGTSPCPLPVIPGHEAAGVVEAVGSGVTGLKPGDHVVGCLSVFCGHCQYCTTGRLVLCDTAEVKIPPGKARRLSRRGVHVNQLHNLSAFAEQMLVHEHALVKIRPDMPLDRAALIGCGVLTGTGAVFRTAAVEAGSTVAVIGCGGVGLSAVIGARMAGALRIIAVDRVPARLEAAQRFGATDVVDASKVDPVAAVIEMTKGGVNYAFECIGLKPTAEQCFRMLAPGGCATLVGVFPSTTLEFNARDFIRQRRVQGSLMGSNRLPVDVPRLVEFYMQGRLPLDEMISQRLPLSRINEGFEAMKGTGVGRSVVVFPGVGD